MVTNRRRKKRRNRSGNQWEKKNNLTGINAQNPVKIHFSRMTGENASTRQNGGHCVPESAGPWFNFEKFRLERGTRAKVYSYFFVRARWSSGSVLVRCHWLWWFWSSLSTLNRCMEGDGDHRMTEFKRVRHLVYHWDLTGAKKYLLSSVIYFLLYLTIFCHFSATSCTCVCMCACLYVRVRSKNKCVCGKDKWVHRQKSMFFITLNDNANTIPLNLDKSMNIRNLRLSELLGLM